MTPGTYLRMRREAAGLDHQTVAWRLTLLPEARPSITASDVDLLGRQLAECEADRDNLTALQAVFVGKVVPLDYSVYEVLLWRHHDPYQRGLLPEPQVCRVCACSWHRPCESVCGPCAWVEGDPTLCTACAAKEALAGRAPAAQHQGAPA